MKVVVIEAGKASREFLLEQGSNLIGRWDPDGAAFPEIDLEEHDPEAKVSRKHAVLLVQGDQVKVEDAGSLNGTFLRRAGAAEQQLVPGQAVELTDADEIVVGKTVLRFYKK